MRTVPAVVGVNVITLSVSVKDFLTPSDAMTTLLEHPLNVAMSAVILTGIPFFKVEGVMTYVPPTTDNVASCTSPLTTVEAAGNTVVSLVASLDESRLDIMKTVKVAAITNITAENIITLRMILSILTSHNSLINFESIPITLYPNSIDLGP
jgi:hypothetical protein